MYWIEILVECYKMSIIAITFSHLNSPILSYSPPILILSYPFLLFPLFLLFLTYLNLPSSYLLLSYTTLTLCQSFLFFSHLIFPQLYSVRRDLTAGGRWTSKTSCPQDLWGTYVCHIICILLVVRLSVY